MPDDPPQNGPAVHWLEKYVDALLEEKQRQLDTRFADLHTRLGGMNEFRQQLDQQARTFALKDAVLLIEKRLDEKLNAVLERISALEGTRANLEGRIWGIALIVVVLEIALKVFWK